MLYDEPAAMLQKAGALLTSGELGSMTAAQQRTIGVQLARLGAMWPDLFVTLDAENATLVAARDEIAEALASNGHSGVVATGDDPADPIDRYRHVLRQLNDVMPLLHEIRREAWGGAALARLRTAIHAAGAIEARMVDKAWAV